MDIPHPPGCPACGSSRPLSPVEEHLDRIGGKKYRVLSCAECGVVSSEPREPVGAEWYEKAAPIRHRESRPAPESDWRFRQFFADAVPAGKLLDVGCGDGAFMALAAAHGFTVAGFDYDERVVAQARARGLKDAHAMEFTRFCAGRKPGEFDAAVLFDVLEHTPEPAWFFGEVKRLLKPGAYVALTLPNGRRPLPWGREEHDFPPHHYTRWTPEAMRGFLERQGFEVVRQEAGSLKLRYLSDHFFFYRLMPGILAFARELLFGRASGAQGATISELYDKAGAGKPGVLSDKLRRQQLVNAARLIFQILFTPLAFLMALHYRLHEPLCGDCLYTLARRTTTQ